MDKKQLCEIIKKLYEEAKDNYIPSLPESRLYEAPLVGVGSASDPLFSDFKKPGVIGPWYMTPTEWLPEEFPTS